MWETSSPAAGVGPRNAVWPACLDTELSVMEQKNYPNDDHILTDVHSLIREAKFTASLNSINERNNINAV